MINLSQTEGVFLVLLLKVLTLQRPREQAYFMMEEVLFKGKHFRGDIAAKALHR